MNLNETSFREVCQQAVRSQYRLYRIWIDQLANIDIEDPFALVDSRVSMMLNNINLIIENNNNYRMLSQENSVLAEALKREYINLATEYGNRYANNKLDEQRHY
ncbi:hypothetical protein ABN763_16100 [Spongiivirga sp. MCCC 1A20706]|uniref:hypothetical protein n=1 Tax=Spongiivirga sp. MCCC 1A20706 TaxID=3160963 RepID=UPI0039776CEB